MRITVNVHPNSKRARIEKDLLGTLHVYVVQPPLQGRANQAAIEALAKHFQTKKSCIYLIAGTKSKIKVFEVGD